MHGHEQGYKLGTSTYRGWITICASAWEGLEPGSGFNSHHVM